MLNHCSTRSMDSATLIVYVPSRLGGASRVCLVPLEQLLLQHRSNHSSIHVTCLLSLPKRNVRYVQYLCRFVVMAAKHDVIAVGAVSRCIMQRTAFISVDSFIDFAIIPDKQPYIEDLPILHTHDIHRMCLHVFETLACEGAHQYVHITRKHG